MIEKLQGILNQKRVIIQEWLDKKRKEIALPVYSSFDIRDNGTKAAIIDSNLFPGGFNNLDQEAKLEAKESIKKFIESKTDSKNILVIPEAHTRNQFYLSNLCAIREILEKAGFNPTLGTTRDDIEESMEVLDIHSHTLILEKLNKTNGDLHTKSFKEGLILLNNDFSVEAPPLLKNVNNLILPPLHLSWVHRKKFNHFREYCLLIEEFTKLIGVDCWFFCPLTKEVNDVNFATKKNLDKIAETVDKMIKEIQEKYDKYNIKEKPFCFVKDNSGTYGMGIISVQSGLEILDLNSKGRQKMKLGKQKAQINSIIVQEGISTKFSTDKGTAEPVIYSVGGKVVGGFMRIHDKKDNKSNLNAPGVKFDTVLKADLTCPIENCVSDKGSLPLYELLADIANLAIGMEMKND